jgi:hypothetical protein
MQPQPLPGPAPCSDYAPVPRLDQRCEQVVEFATARLGFVHLCGLTFGSGPKVWSRVSSPVHACHAARINSWAARVRCHALPALPIFSQIGAEGGNDLLRLLTCQSHGALSNLPAEARSGEGRKLATVLLRRAGAGASGALCSHRSRADPGAGPPHTALGANSLGARCRDLVRAAAKAESLTAPAEARLSTIWRAAAFRPAALSRSSSEAVRAQRCMRRSSTRISPASVAA